MRNTLSMLILVVLVALVGRIDALCQKAAPLKYELAAVNREICMGEANVILRARITNVSKRALVVDENALTHAVSISTTRLETGKIIGSNQTDLNEDLRTGGGSYVIVGPQRFIELPLRYPLDNEFFIREGSYRIRATYGQFADESYGNLPVWRGAVNSNYVSFKLKKCSGNSHGRDQDRNLLLR